MDTIPDVPAEVNDEQLTEGLRERKKRLMQQMLSDTATMLFLERGFDGFKVTDVADACGVSEKTVYNYFPTKEALILDQEENTAEAIRHAIGPGATKSPVEAIVDVLVMQRRQMREGLSDTGGDDAGLALLRRFASQLEQTPSLRAAYGEMMERLARVAAEALAERAGVSPDDPEPMIAGHALVGLADVQQRALLRDVESDKSVDDVYDRADAELRRAAQLIDTGLWSFATSTGADGREQLRAAAETMGQAGRQVATALRQARKAFLDAQAAHADQDGEAPDQWSTLHKMWQDHGDEWRAVQREQVQRWRESQREQQRAWREAQRESQRHFQQEQRESRRRMKEDLKEAARGIKEEAKRKAKQQ
jgi:AcrR family transcriptional regulator